jgi:anti-sigma factor RsiW
MKCQDMLKMLNEYVDGELDPAVCDEFERHMKGCNPCQVVIDNIRRTIRLYKGNQEVELPAEFRRKLHHTLAATWKQRQQQ